MRCRPVRYSSRLASWIEAMLRRADGYELKPIPVTAAVGRCWWDLRRHRLLVVACRSGAVEQLVVIRRESRPHQRRGFGPFIEKAAMTERADLPVRHDRAVSVRQPR